MQFPPADSTSHSLKRRWLGTRFYWLAQLLGWGGMCGVLAVSIYGSTKPAERSYELVSTVTWAIGGIFFTHLLRVMLIYYRSLRLTWWGLLLRLGLWLVAVNLALTLATILLLHLLMHMTGSSLARSHDPLDISDVVIVNVLALMPWVSLYYGINYYRSFQQSLVEKFRLEAAVKEAELRSLRAQVDPHFLFNSLNTLRALIPRDLPAPREAVTLLSEVLRTSLSSSARPAVSLAEELDHVENYLALEKLRLEHRLQVRRTIAPNARACLVPTLLVQTLVENAVKYGVAAREQQSVIELDAKIIGDLLHVAVTNPGTIDESTVSTGLGLKNARARLGLIFGPAASLSLRASGPDSVRAEMCVPLLEQEQLGPPASFSATTRSAGATQSTSPLNT